MQHNGIIDVFSGARLSVGSVESQKPGDRAERTEWHRLCDAQADPDPWHKTISEDTAGP